MSTVSQRFQKFLSNIQLTQKQKKDAKTKYDGVCEKLHDYYYASNYDGSTRILVGSYGKNTAIAPPSDVDVMFVMPTNEYYRYNNYSGNGQSQLLQDIRNKLLEKYPTTYIRGDGQVVMVNFITYNIEVIPGFLLTNENYFIPDTHEGGSWRETSPKSELASLRWSNKHSKGNTIRLIKMIKAWKHHCNVPIKSLVIELRAVNFLKKWKHYDKSYTYYDWMVRDFFRELLDYVDGHCKIPGIEEIIFYGDGWESKAISALQRAETACEFEANKEYRSATKEWKNIFGERFNY